MSRPALLPSGLPHANPEAGFDTSGNLRSLDHLRTLDYAWHDRLRRAVVIDRVGIGQPNDEERYAYDADGRRARKVSSRLVGGALETTETIDLPTSTRRVVRRGGAVILDRWTGFVTADDSRVASVRRWSVDTHARETNDVARTRFSYVVANHQGSATLELDERAAVVAYEEYFPFGGTAFVAGASQREVKLRDQRYRGKSYDDATGLYDFGHRLYAPWLRRWLTPDPAGPADDLNLYQYVRGDPVGNVDFDGLQTVPQTRRQLRVKPRVRGSLSERRPIVATVSSRQHRFSLAGFVALWERLRALESARRPNQRASVAITARRRLKTTASSDSAHGDDAVPAGAVPDQVAPSPGPGVIEAEASSAAPDGVLDPTVRSEDTDGEGDATRDGRSARDENDGKVRDLDGGASTDEATDPASRGPRRTSLKAGPVIEGGDGAESTNANNLGFRSAVPGGGGEKQGLGEGVRAFEQTDPNGYEDPTGLRSVPTSSNNSAKGQAFDASRYIDSFRHAVYLPSFRSRDGRLSQWVLLYYADGAQVPVNMADVQRASVDPKLVIAQMTIHEGEGGRQVPNELNRVTTPRLAAAVESAERAMEEYNLSFTMDVAVQAIVLPLVTGSGPRFAQAGQMRKMNFRWSSPPENASSGTGTWYTWAQKGTVNHYIQANLEAGTLRFTVRARGGRGPTGTKMLDGAIEHFGAENVHAIKASWSSRNPLYNTNYNQLRGSMKGGTPLSKAVLDTWTGRQAAKRGFRSVTSITDQGSGRSISPDISVADLPPAIEVVFSR